MVATVARAQPGAQQAAGSKGGSGVALYNGGASESESGAAGDISKSNTSPASEAGKSVNRSSDGEGWYSVCDG